MKNITVALLLFIASMGLYYANKIHRISMREKWGEPEVYQKIKYFRDWMYIVVCDLTAVGFLIAALINESTVSWAAAVICMALAIGYGIFHRWFKRYLRSQDERVTGGDKFNAFRVYAIMVILIWSAFIFMMAAIFKE